MSKDLRDLLREAELTFKAPVHFEFQQSSDQTGERYVSCARFVDSGGCVILDIANEDWVDDQMHAIADVLSALPQLLADKARLDWLEFRHVEAREPLMYGSRHIFHAYPGGDEDEEARPSSLRAQIDERLLTQDQGEKK